MSMQPPKPTSGKAIASLVLGLLSFCVPILLTIPAVILGFLALADVRGGRAKGGAMAVIGLLFGFLSIFCGIGYGVGGYFAWMGVTRAANRMASQNNLMQIGIALHEHQDTFRTFPPQAITGKQGEPLLSWRVAILPFIEQNNLYKMIHLDEPWDSPHNKQFLKQMPKIYANPLKPQGAKDGLTYYQVFFCEQNDAQPVPPHFRP